MRDENGMVQVTGPSAALEMFDTGEGNYGYHRVIDAAGHLIAGAADLPFSLDRPDYATAA